MMVASRSPLLISSDLNASWGSGPPPFLVTPTSAESKVLFVVGVRRT